MRLYVPKPAAPDVPALLSVKGTAPTFTALSGSMALRKYSEPSIVTGLLKLMTLPSQSTL